MHRQDDALLARQLRQLGPHRRLPAAATHHAALAAHAAAAAHAARHGRSDAHKQHQRDTHQHGCTVASDTHATHAAAAAHSAAATTALATSTPDRVDGAAARDGGVVHSAGAHRRGVQQRHRRPHGPFNLRPVDVLYKGNQRRVAREAESALVTTTLAAACGCVTAMFTDTYLDYRNTGEATYDLTMAMNGCLAGLVAITAGCSVVTPWAAVIIGTIGGWVYYGFSKFLIHMKIDDAVDAIPVHFANGIWGVISVGLFAEPDLMAVAGYNNLHTGWFYSWSKGTGDANLLLVQFVGVIWILGWVFSLMTPFFFMLNAAGMFRVDALEEDVGLDISHHRGAAYDLTGPKNDDVEELMEIRASRHGKVEVPKEVAQAAAGTQENEA